MDKIIEKLDNQINKALDKDNLSISELYELTKVIKDLKEIRG